MGDCEDMSFSDFIIKNFFTIMLVDVMVFVLLIGIFNPKMAYMYAVCGIIVLIATKKK